MGLSHLRAYLASIANIRGSRAVHLSGEEAVKTKRVNRYYCDHCRKSGCSAYHIRHHEERCTLNPNRVCGMCKLLDQDQPSLPAIITLLPHAVEYQRHEKEFDYDFYSEELSKAIMEVLPKVRELAGNCPACIMAALRQAGIPVPMADGFNFTSECKSVWNDVNSRGY